MRRLDISDHPEFFMTEEAKEALEFKELLGISKEDKKKVTFSEHRSKVEDILSKLHSLEELRCDEDLEAYVLENRHLLPSLRLLNDVSINISDIEQRKKLKTSAALFAKIQRVAGHYTLNEGGEPVTSWFVNDEVGSVIGHSDIPNVRMMTILYSKTNSPVDLVPFTVMWPVKDIGANEAIVRDKLHGYDESQFRSARLRVWYETPDDYYKKQLGLWRALKLDDIAPLNATMQSKPPLEQP